jgi:hypothetical protein
MQLFWLIPCLLSIINLASSYRHHNRALIGRNIRRNDLLIEMVIDNDLLTKKEVSGNAIVQDNLWKSVQSLNPDADLAVEEVMRDLSVFMSHEESTSYAMIFFISSIYESASFRYENIFDKAKAILPQVTEIIGCTTACPIGQSSSLSSPIEAESRPSLSAMLIPISQDSGIQVKSFCISSESYSQEDISSAVGNDSITMAFASKDAQTLLSKLIQEKKHGKIIGSLASCVTALQNSKVFQWRSSDNKVTKMSRGIVGINIRGNVDLHVGIANSCKPVGPVFKLSEVVGSNIRTMEVSFTRLHPQSFRYIVCYGFRSTDKMALQRHHWFI